MRMRLWSPVVVEAEVPGTPQQVYRVIADPDTYPDWLVGAERIRSVDPSFPTPGSEFEHSVGAGGPVTIDDRTESLAADAPSHLGLLAHAGPFHGRVDFDLLATGGSTTVRLSEQLVGPLAIIAPLLRPSLRARNVLSLRHLSQLMTGRLGTLRPL